MRFDWGEFRFTGFMQHIHADYVMFSPSGNPIRAYVTIRLKNDFDSDIGMWKGALSQFEGLQAFEGSSGAVSAAKNLLNISW
jgi:hypothetical protein